VSVLWGALAALAVASSSVSGHAAAEGAAAATTAVAEPAAGSPAAPAAAPVVDPAQKDGDVMISAGKDLAIQGAISGDRLMTRNGRRMIRDGALLKRTQQMAK
jgi:hypothetical protein